MKTIVCRSLNEFELMQCAWDRLWHASHTSNPTAKSAALASAVRHFFGGQGFLALILFEADQAVAAIPLVKQKLKKFLSVYGLPNNSWGRWGELLIHPEHDCQATYDRLAKALGDATTLGIQLDNIDSSLPNWKRFISALERQSRKSLGSFAFHVGVIQNDSSWSSYRSRLSSGFRKKLRKYSRGLEQQGEVSGELHFNFEGVAIDKLVAAAFEVEQRGWKSQRGSSVIASRQFDFYLEQARILAADGHLRISFLRLDERIIAFDFGSLAKHTYYSWKIGYDSKYARFAPGQLLAQFLTRTFHDTGECRVQDTVGPLTDATAKWITGYSSQYNVLVRGTSYSAIAGYQFLQAARLLKRGLRRLDSKVAPPMVNPAQQARPLPKAQLAAS